MTIYPEDVDIGQKVWLEPIDKVINRTMIKIIFFIDYVNLKIIYNEKIFKVYFFFFNYLYKTKTYIFIYLLYKILF